MLGCTGPVTHQMRERLRRIHDQMPEPRLVVAIGTCACSGGVFDGCYCVEGGVDAVVPVAAYVPGCPARPEAIIDGFVKLLRTLEDAPAAAAPAPGTSSGSGTGTERPAEDREAAHG